MTPKKKHIKFRLKVKLEVFIEQEEGIIPIPIFSTYQTFSGTEKINSTCTNLGKQLGDFVENNLDSDFFDIKTKTNFSV